MQVQGGERNNQLHGRRVVPDTIAHRPPVGSPHFTVLETKAPADAREGTEITQQAGDYVAQLVRPGIQDACRAPHPTEKVDRMIDRLENIPVIFENVRAGTQGVVI